MMDNTTMVETPELITPSMMEPQELITPYGGRLVNLLVSGQERDELVRQAASLPSANISTLVMRPDLARAVAVLVAATANTQPLLLRRLK